MVVAGAGFTRGLPAPPTKRRAPTSTSVLLIAAFGAFLAFLDSTIVNVAFPSIRASFPGTSASTLSWVLNAYNIVFGAFLVASGRIADLLGRRRMFLLGVFVFTTSSVACALAATPLQLILFRIAQGFGAAMLVPASLALVIEVFPDEHTTHGVTLWGAAAALAAGLGPPIGGALVTGASWRLAFLINLPVGVAAYVVGRRGLVESRAPGHRHVPDLRGALLLAAGLSLVTLAIIKGSDWGWSSGLVVGAFLFGALLLIGFAMSNRVHASPILDPDLLKLRRFSVANVFTIFAGAGFYAYTLNHILWLNYVWHYSLFQAGLAVAPGAIVAAAVARPFGGLAERRGHPQVIVAGAAVWAVALSFFYAHRVGVTPDFLGEWLPAQIVSGIGVGAVLPLLASAAVVGVPGRRYATASAAVSGSRQLGAVIGIAILVVILGTHRGAALVSAFRQGWEFSAACFAIVAVGSLFLGRDPARVEFEQKSDGAVRPWRLDDKADHALVVDRGASAEAEQPSIFSDLPEEALAVVEGALAGVDLLAGGWLFHAGDRSDAIYFIEHGQLEVVADDRVVARLGKGDIVGELALLTGEVRNASIRARRDSRLLRLDAERFAEVATLEPKIPIAIARTLAGRLQRVEAPALGERPSRVIAVVGADGDAPVDVVSGGLVLEMAMYLRVVDPGRIEADGLERVEQQFDRIVLTAGCGDPPWRDFCLRVADRVIIVSSSQPPSADAFAAIRPGGDLVLASPAPRAAVHAWYDALEPSSVHVLNVGSAAESLRPLAARLMGLSIGLVLSGGGARALCHLGVIEVFEDAKIPVDRVSGTSAGAVIGGLFAAGYNAAELDAVIYEEFVRNNPHSDYTIPRYGLTRGQKTQAALMRWFGDVTIEELSREFRCVSVDLWRRETIIHQRGPVVDAVMASLRLPGLFSPYRISNALHVDGGVMDNIPVAALKGPPEGPLLAVAVDLGESASRGEDRGLPGILETIMQSMLISSRQGAEQSLAKADVVIRPRADSVGLLEWHQIDVMLEAGREAARAALPSVTDLLGKALL